jgi:hypothetical protein
MAHRQGDARPVFEAAEFDQQFAVRRQDRHAGKDAAQKALFDSGQCRAPGGRRAGVGLAQRVQQCRVGRERRRQPRPVAHHGLEELGPVRERGLHPLLERRFAALGGQHEPGQAAGEGEHEQDQGGERGNALVLAVGVGPAALHGAEPEGP